MGAKLQFFPEGAVFQDSGFPQYVRNLGTNFPVSGLAFGDSAMEACFYKFRAVDYVSGNLTLALDWYADTAVSGVVRWLAAIAVITPDTDTQDVETKAFGTDASVDDTHLGTTGQRLHRALLTISSLDSLAAEDWVVLRIRRWGNDAADTLSGDAILTEATLIYS